MEENRLRLQKFDQIGILVSDIDNSANYLGSLLQFNSTINIIEQESTVFYKGKEIKFKMKKIMQNFGGKQFEIIQVVESSGDHLYLDFINNQNEGLHHLGIYTKNAQDLIDNFKKNYDLEVIQSGKAGKVKFYFLDTWKLIGFYLELISF